MCLFQMRTDSAIPSATRIAVEAECLESFRETLLDQPVIEILRLFAVLSTTAIDVVYCQEERFSLRATSTRPTVVIKYSCPSGRIATLVPFPCSFFPSGRGLFSKGAIFADTATYAFAVARANPAYPTQARRQSRTVSTTGVFAASFL